MATTPMATLFPPPSLSLPLEGGGNPSGQAQVVIGIMKWVSGVFER